MIKNKFKAIFFVSLLSFSLFTGLSNKTYKKIEETKIILNARRATNNYYAGVDESSGKNLFYSLRKIISAGFNSLGYGGLWTAYKGVYKRSDGKVNDYYSNTTNFSFSKQCGNYKGEGDCYNREHTIPKSYWGGSTSNQGCDVFIVIPTDGYVNNKRSSYPFGEVNNASYSSNNGFSKLGSSSKGTVFEPNDKYKGDIARMMFYAVTRWESSSNWTKGNGNICFGNNQYVLTNYAKELFLKWHNQDPVDDWEIDVNDNAYNYQKNRNPYIDHPEWVDVIWGNGSVTPTPTPSLTLDKTNIDMNVDEAISVKATTKNTDSQVIWSSSNSEVAKYESGYIKGLKEGSATITAALQVNPSIKATCNVNVKKVNVSDDQQAINYAKTFLDFTAPKCNELKIQTKETWAYLKEEYNELSEGAKTIFLDKNNTLTSPALDRYIFIVNKYDELEDFMNIKAMNQSSFIANQNSNEIDGLIELIIVISVISISFIISYSSYLIYKKLKRK